MSFLGVPEVLPFKRAASETFALNDVVTRDASGYVTKATASTPRSRILGLIQRAVLATDTDYATNAEVEVLLVNPAEGLEFTADVDTGSAIQAMVGKSVDLADHNGLNVNTSTRKHFKITRIISTSKVKGTFNVDGEAARLVSYSQTFAYADFTDGGSTVGTLALGCTIPAGAVFAQSLLTGLTGFAGDTTATITVGDSGGDVDRYSTGTPSVFTTAAAGIDLGVPSGTKFHADAVVPDVIITKGSDWGTGTSGAGTIHLFWYEAIA